MLLCEKITFLDVIVNGYSIDFFYIKAAIKYEPFFPEVGSEIIPRDGHLEWKCSSGRFPSKPQDTALLALSPSHPRTRNSIRIGVSIPVHSSYASRLERAWILHTGDCC